MREWVDIDRSCRRFQGDELWQSGVNVYTTDSDECSPRGRTGQKKIAVGIGCDAGQQLIRVWGSVVVCVNVDGCATDIAIGNDSLRKTCGVIASDVLNHVDIVGLCSFCVSHGHGVACAEGFSQMQDHGVSVDGDVVNSICYAACGDLKR